MPAAGYNWTGHHTGLGHIIKDQNWRGSVHMVANNCWRMDG